MNNCIFTNKYSLNFLFRLKWNTGAMAAKEKGGDCWCSATTKNGCDGFRGNDILSFCYLFGNAVGFHPVVTGLRKGVRGSV